MDQQTSSMPTGAIIYDAYTSIKKKKKKKNWYVLNNFLIVSYNENSVL